MTLQYKVVYKTKELNDWLKEIEDSDYISDVEVNIEVNNEGEPTFIVSYNEEFEEEE